MSPARSSRRHTRWPGAPRLRSFDLALITAIAAVGAGSYALSSHAAEQTPAGWRWSLPKRFPVPRVPASNPMSAAKVELGRRLFYDVRLSGNGTQSCGSCHLQALAFTDARATAIGSTGQAHPRNSQSLVNVAYEATLTWANPSLVRLEKQMEVPLFGSAPIELGITDANKDVILARIRKDPWYRKRFARAFPKAKTTVSWPAIVQSIASFERSIISARSKYDRYLDGKTKFTLSETRGMNIFMGERAECHHCHGNFIFNDQATYVGAEEVVPVFHNTGLYNLGGTGAFPEPNRGVFELTGKASDMGKFRAPSLRNVELTAPYMHDGSIATLEEAVTHYSDGGRLIQSGPLAGDGRANPNKDPMITALNLTTQERADLVAFLRTLTDQAVTKDPRFADPFRSARRTATD